MIRIFFIPVMTFISFACIQAQNTEEEYLKNYEVRIMQERINDVYIPKDLADAMRELDRLTDDKAASKLKTSSEDTIASKLHFSLGRWMQLHWGLEEGSRLSHYLKSNGLSFPDDMMDFLIRSWYRHINNLPLKDTQLIQKYIAKRKEEYLKNIQSIDTIRVEGKLKARY